MKIPRAILTTVLGSSLVLGAHAGFGASSSSAGHVPAGQILKVNVILKDAVLCDGSVRLEAGLYEVNIRSLGDGSARVTFKGNGKTGQATGKVQGRDGVVVEGGLQPGTADPMQKVQPVGVVVEGGKQPSLAPSFASFGFTPQSQASFQKQGNHLNVIVKGQGSNQILIGLLLPAVQKVREAAVPPASGAAQGTSKIKN